MLGALGSAGGRVHGLGGLHVRPGRARPAGRRRAAESAAPSSSAIAVVPSASPSRHGEPRGLGRAVPSAAPPAAPSVERQSPEPDARPPDADPESRPARRPSPSAVRHARPELGSLRPADGVPGQAGLLAVPRPVRRQPVQHREVLRRAARDRQGPEPVDRVRAQGGSRPDPAAARPAEASPRPEPAGRGQDHGRATRMCVRCTRRHWSPRHDAQPEAVHARRRPSLAWIHDRCAPQGASAAHR